MVKSASYMRRYRAYHRQIILEESGKAITYVSDTPDSRSSIQQMFREIGFVDVLGTDDIPTALLGAYAIRLNQLEREYGAVSASTDPYFRAGIGDDWIALVERAPNDCADQSLVININKLGNLQTNVTTQREKEAEGWFAPTNGSITNSANYAVTHEYGHMVENVLASQAGYGKDVFTYSEKVQQEVTNIAHSFTGATNNSYTSIYSTDNPREFFAESFANLHSGAPDAYGEALGIWLESHKIK